jgi:phosphoribosylformylglycinamidine synthase
MRARVTILPKRSVLDPQGGAVLRALHALGHDGVSGVHVGRIVELDLDTDDAGTAHEQVAAMCDELLANLVIERYEVELLDGAGRSLVGAGA